MIKSSPIPTDWEPERRGPRRMDLPIRSPPLIEGQRSFSKEISFNLIYYLRKIEKDVPLADYGRSESLKDLSISKVKKFLSKEKEISPFPPKAPKAHREIKKEFKSLWEGIIKKIQPLPESEKGKFSKLLISSIEADTSILFSKGFTKFLRGYVGFTSQMERLARKKFNKFAKSISGKPMDEETQRFLINEFIYLGLKLKEGNLKWQKR